MKLILVSLLLASNSWAFTQEDINANIALMNQQTQTIAGRLNDDGDDCDDMFEPLPGKAGPIAFHSAVAAIENQAANLQRYLSSECMNLLAQNLATLPASANARTVIQRLIDISRPIVEDDRSVQRACVAATLDFPELKELMRSVSSATECGPLNVGKAKRVNGRAPFGNRTVDYLLAQDKPNNYRAVLNVDFKQNGSTVTSAQMLARAKGCLAAAGGSMKGPGGKSLQIELLSPAEMAASGIPAANRPKAQTVNISPGEIGSNAGNYQENIACPTLVHEVMHLMGLCDEYSGDRDGFACRARGPVDSIMESAETAFARSVPRRVTCECEDKDLCRALKASPANREFIRQPRFEQITNIRFRNLYCNKRDLDSDYVEAWLKNEDFKAQTYAEQGENTNGGVIFREINLDNNGQVEGFVYTCKCATGNIAECQRASARLIQGPHESVGHDCPPHTKRTEITWGASSGSGSATDNTVTFDVPAVAGSSLLQPAHFNRILDGTCPSKSSRYNSCASFAYETDPSVCAYAPDYCQSASWLQEETP
jgi:hypothetical protein